MLELPRKQDIAAVLRLRRQLYDIITLPICTLVCIKRKIEFLTSDFNSMRIRFCGAKKYTYTQTMSVRSSVCLSHHRRGVRATIVCVLTHAIAGNAGIGRKLKLIMASRLFIYSIYQSTAWKSENNKHQINAISGLNGKCRDSPLKHGQHKG